MTLYYSKQPTTLPPSLPPGTRYKFAEALSTQGCFPDGAKLNGELYVGKTRRDDGTERDEMSIHASYIHWRKVPMVGGEAADREFSVGDYVEALTTEGSIHGAGVSVRGWLQCIDDFVIGSSALCFAREDLDSGLPSATVRTESIRRLSAPTPSVPEPVATPTPKVGPDPYGTKGRPEADKLVAAATYMVDAISAKRARFTADTLDGFGSNDLDRPLLKLGGRFGKRIENSHPRGWPEGSDHE
jgi:hypothetical protein